MSATQMEIKCPKCSGTQFSYPTKPQLQAADPVTCAGCGFNTTVGKLRQKGRKQAQKLLADRFGSRFKPSK